MTASHDRDRRQLVEAARRASRVGGGTVLDHLLSQTLPNERPALLAWLEDQAGVAVILPPHDVEIRTDELPASLARETRSVALRSPGAAGSVIGMSDPWDHAAIQLLARHLGQVPTVAAVTEAALQSSLAVDAVAPKGAVPREAAPEAGAVVDFVDSAIGVAIRTGASDIHFETDRQGVEVKLRIDGVMQHHSRWREPSRAEEVISRIKVMAQLDITERRVPQDGRFRFLSGAADLDLRVSIMPSVHGEDAVLRLLDKAQLRDSRHGISLDQLGFDADSAAELRGLGELPHGMLLVTGPTGSGKTTTVYALLSELNSGFEKLITIEDPVEYELPGVLQIPVNDRKGLSFARGLRSILRHDPDRILVGEIRDAETAEIAIQSALTGHQVLTTVHANSIYDVIGRFRHFGLDMYSFMSALNGVVVQRLLRRICTQCAAQRPVTAVERSWLAVHGLKTDITVHAPGCKTCGGTGYRGRMVLAEVHRLDDTLRDLAIVQAPLSALRSHVDSLHRPTLHRQAAAQVLAGLTTFDEVRRVLGWR